MNYKIIELNEKELKFRLKSKDSVEIEKITGKSLFDVIANLTMTNVIMLLKYMRKSEIDSFSDKNAYDLYDELVDSGYTLERIGYDIIFPTMVVSGFLTQEELEDLVGTAREKRKQTPEEQ